eukprot:1194353-Prorocentrum_minimum.AAC.10
MAKAYLLGHTHCGGLHLRVEVVANARGRPLRDGQHLLVLEGALAAEEGHRGARAVHQHHHLPAPKEHTLSCILSAVCSQLSRLNRDTAVPERSTTTTT